MLFNEQLATELDFHWHMASLASLQGRSWMQNFMEDSRFIKVRCLWRGWWCGGRQAKKSIVLSMNSGRLPPLICLCPYITAYALRRSYSYDRARAWRVWWTRVHLLNILCNVLSKSAWKATLCKLIVFLRLPSKGSNGWSSFAAPRDFLVISANKLAWILVRFGPTIFLEFSIRKQIEDEGKRWGPRERCAVFTDFDCRAQLLKKRRSCNMLRICSPSR